MKKDTHPTYYYDAKVTCACGNTWTTGSIKPEIRTEVCSKCHPFFTGQQQRLLDMEGQVDRFYRRLQARQNFLADKQVREEAKQPCNLTLDDLNLNKLTLYHFTEVLHITKVSEILDIFEKGGDDGLLALDGVKQGRLAEIKKAIRDKGIELA